MNFTDRSLVSYVTNQSAISFDKFFTSEYTHPMNRHDLRSAQKQPDFSYGYPRYLAPAPRPLMGRVAAYAVWFAMIAASLYLVAHA